MLDAADVVVIPTWAQVASAWTMLRAHRRGVPYVIFSESTLDSRQFDHGPSPGCAPGCSPAPARSSCRARRPARRRSTPGWRPTGSSSRSTRSTSRPSGPGPGTCAPGPAADTGPDAAHHRFVVVGQLIARKNVGTLLEAFARLDGAPTLDVAGDGVERDELEADRPGLGIADRVHFHGFLDEAGVVGMLARTQTLVLPSTEEVYGFTALEAQVAGLQVVVSAHAGIAENLADTPGAWVVAPDVEGVQRGLEAARTAWTGWTEEIPADAASPKRSADDVLAGALRACEHRHRVLGRTTAHERVSAPG